jgi:hypothetical protein
MLPTILQIKSSSVVIVAAQCVMCQCALSAMCGAFSRSVPWHSVNHPKPFYATLHYNVAIRVNSESHKWHLAHLLTKQNKFTYIFFRVDHRGYHPHAAAEVDDPLFPYSLLAEIECMFYFNVPGRPMMDR